MLCQKRIAHSMCIYETQKFRDRKGAFPINKLWPRDIGDVAKEQNLV